MILTGCGDYLNFCNAAGHYDDYVAPFDHVNSCAGRSWTNTGACNTYHVNNPISPHWTNTNECNETYHVDNSGCYANVAFGNYPDYMNECTDHCVWANLPNNTNWCNDHCVHGNTGGHTETCNPYQNHAHYGGSIQGNGFWEDCGPGDYYPLCCFWEHYPDDNDMNLLHSNGNYGHSHSMGYDNACKYTNAAWCNDHDNYADMWPDDCHYTNAAWCNSYDNWDNFDNSPFNNFCNHNNTYL